MADDSGGKLWVMDSGTATLMAFPRGANGTVVPSQIIAGRRTKLYGIDNAAYQGIGLDAAENVWVPVWYERGSYLVAYSNTASGNVKPVQTIGVGDLGQSEDLGGAVGVTFDSKGNLYVGEYLSYRVVVFSPPFTDTSKPVAVWSGPQGAISKYMSVDSHDNLYVGGDNTIVVYKGALKSKGVYSYIIDPPKNTGFYDVKVDQQDHLFAAMIAGARGSRPNAIGVNPIGAKTFHDAHFITSTPMENPPISLAVGP